MKNTIIIICFLLSVSAFPQQKERAEKRFHHTNMTTEEMATLQAKRMALQLDLNKSQQNEVQQLFTTEMNEREARKENYKDRENIDRDSSKANHFKLMNSRLDRQLAMQERMKKILDSNQYDKWKSLSRKSMHHRKRRHEEARDRMRMDSTRTHTRNELHKN